MSIFRPVFAIMVAVLALPALGQDKSVPMGTREACMGGPLAQFGQYIGDWDIEDSRLGPDGKEWTAGTGARWNFICLGDGMAIQDFWIPNDGPIGTNLRTWNSATESWDIAWAIKGLPGFAHIQAEMDVSGNVVMHYKSPVPNPLRQITFFPADSNGWRWTLEVSSDGGANWTEVYRIQATRRAESP